MNNSEEEKTYKLVVQLAEREGIEPARVIEIISKSFIDGYHSKVNNDTEIKITFQKEDEIFHAYSVFEIVDIVDNPNKQISTNDQQIETAEKIVGNQAFFGIDLKNLTKFVGFEIRKNIQRLIQDLRKEKQYQNFFPLKGELVTGTIQSIQKDFCIINLGKGLGYWDETQKETTPERNRNNNYLGKSMRFLLTDVQEKSDLRQLVLSRKGESFLRKLFEFEVPEIKEGIVSIEKILRIPGLVSKVIVKSNNPSIDPVGACIGKKGIRIRAVLEEFTQERIDLVGWNENKKRLLFNIISPVEVISLLESDDKWTIFIPEHRMSLALHGDGRVIRKISEYLEINLHIKSFEKSQADNDIVVWNGNINFDEYEIRKDLFNSKQKRLNLEEN